MGAVGGTEWIVIIVAILILFFGAKKIPELARGIGEGINEFKDATNKDATNQELNDNKKNENNTPSDSTEKQKTKAKS